MERNEAALSSHRFTVASIPELASYLTNNQKLLFNNAWSTYVSFGRLFPLRGLKGIFGKQAITEAFCGLNGSLIFETNEQDANSFKLTIYGAFLTDYGPVLASTLVRLLDLIKEICDDDSFIRELNKEQIKERLNLSDSEVLGLFRLLTLGLPPDMPFYLSGYAPDGREWKITLTDKQVLELLYSDSTEEYLDKHLSAYYNPEKPYAYGELLKYVLKSESGAPAIFESDNANSASTSADKRSDLSPWPVIRSFLFSLSSYEVPKIVDRAGLTVDWSLTDKQNYSHKTRLAEYRPRVDAAYQGLSSDNDRLRVAFIVTQELAKIGSIDELNDALQKIGWELRGNMLAPSGSAIGQLFFPDQSQHDAYVEIRTIAQKATSRITIVDPYIDQSILTLLSTCTMPGFVVQILTSKLPADFALEGKKWLTQHSGSSLSVRTTKEFHDRFIVLDNSACWHIGCSIKDAGNKAFMLSELEDLGNREALLAQVARSWNAAVVVL